jgi:chromate transporter
MESIAINDGVDRQPAPTLAQAFVVWLRIGLLSFGGPAAQIALMHREVVDIKGWLTEKQFLNALSFCMLLPGPEAMQLATYAGWRLHGTVGGLIAGLLFVLPGAVVILALALIYGLYGDVPLVNALFLGVKAAVIIIVIEALLKVSKRALHLPEHWVIAALAFIGIFLLALPFPLIIIAAAGFGFMRANRDAVDEQPVRVKVSPSRSLLTTLIWLVIWAAPMLAIASFDNEGLLLDIGIFFSKLAVVTFGGAYAVLAYLGQDVVTQFGWLTAGEMMDGLGLAETTPGPLILVNEFWLLVWIAGRGGNTLGHVYAVFSVDICRRTLYRLDRVAGALARCINRDHGRGGRCHSEPFDLVCFARIFRTGFGAKLRADCAMATRAELSGLARHRARAVECDTAVQVSLGHIARAGAGIG